MKGPPEPRVGTLAEGDKPRQPKSVSRDGRGFGVGSSGDIPGSWLWGGSSGHEPQGAASKTPPSWILFLTYSINIVFRHVWSGEAEPALSAHPPF